MIERVFRFQPEVKGRSLKGAEVRLGEGSKLAMLMETVSNNLSYVLLC